MTKTFIVDSNAGISGSLTELVDGSSYLIAGNGISLLSQSNGSVVISVSENLAPSPFGNGSDGDVIITSDTTLSSDMYYANLTVQAGKSLFNHGYRIFVKEVCIISGTIACDGGAGSNGSGGTPGPAGSGAPIGSMQGGGAGGTSANGDGQPYGVLGVNGRGGSGYLGGVGGTYTPIWQFSQLGNPPNVPDPIAGIIFSTPNETLAVGGGSGGGAGNQGSGGGGGGVIALMANSLTMIAGSSIHANGGANDPNGWGGGGGGGLVVIVSHANNISGSIVANGGVAVGSGQSGAAGGVFQYTL